MKIIHVISSFSPGGAEVLVRDMATNTDKIHTVEVWAVGSAGDPSFEQKFKNELAENKITFINIGKVVHKNRIWVVSKIRQLIKQQKPDVINTHSELATFYCVPAAIGLGVKIVQTIHNTVVTFPILQRFIFKPFIIKYVAISERCRLLIKNVIKAPDKNIELIYNGINLKKFQKQERVIKKDVENILCIGRLDVQKDHETLLRSFSILRNALVENKKPVPKLNLIGIGVLRENLENLAKELQLENYVNFMGARSDIAEQLFANDIWVMSSRWEGLSIALLEALSSGIPIVLTDVGSNSEVIENNITGKLVEKENPPEFANALYSLINDMQLRMKFSKNGELKSTQFNIESCVKNYMNMYNSFFESKVELSFSTTKSL